jgi:predicted kinase
MGQPPLVIVNGAPGSGKSTLAGKLAKALHLPLLMKDDFKETLYDTVGAGGASGLEWSAQLGKAAYGLLYLVANRLVDAGVGAILESNFYRGWAEPELAPLLARTRAVQVHCGGDAAVIIQRYRERAERGERHAGHNDLAVIPRLREYLATGRCEPLELAIPLCRVDTTLSGEGSQYAPAFDAILAFVGRHTGHSV